MTPEEKARKIHFKYNSQTLYDEKTYNHTIHMTNAKICALICVDEILYMLMLYAFSEAPILRRWVGGITSTIKSYSGRLKESPSLIAL